MNAQQAAELFGLLDTKGRWEIPPYTGPEMTLRRERALMSSKADIPLRLRSDAGLQAVLPVCSAVRARVVEAAIATGEVKALIHRTQERVFNRLREHNEFVTITRETKLFSFLEASIILRALPECIEVALHDLAPQKRSK